MADHSTVARPYARAIFEHAQESNALDDWAGRLAFWAAVASNRDMQARLDDPSLTDARRGEMFASVVADGNDEAGRNFIDLLAANDRLAAIPDIFLMFEELRGEAQNEIEATVTSAYPLNDAQKAKLSEALSRRLERQVRLVTEVDPELIGGAVIRAGDLVIDGSLRGRADKMQHALAS